MRLMDLEHEIFGIETEEQWQNAVWKVFQYQKEQCLPYKTYLHTLGKSEPSCIEEIPFLPIQFFKNHRIISDAFDEPEVMFMSSGTTGSIRSKHPVACTELYERSFLPTFEDQVAVLNQSIVFALLPNYVEQGHSSLVYMVERLIEKTEHPLSGFYLNDPKALLQAIDKARLTQRKIILFGVSYALLDLAEIGVDLSDITIIETGGMKGRRKEMTKAELHETLNSAFGTQHILSEYGMCELLSQAYSQRDNSFAFPNWMRAFLREVNDPLTLQSNTVKTGAVNIIDLANLYSCSFIATEDLGRIENNRLQLMGRMDHSEIRGCNLLVE